MKKYLPLFLILFSQIVIAGEPSKTPLQEYENETYFQLTSCKLSLRLALAKAELGEPQLEKDNLGTCISSGTASAKSKLDSALLTIKKPKAKEALKSYHVIFFAAMKAISPASDERAIDYRIRQQNFKDKLTEAWARFEIEQ